MAVEIRNGIRSTPGVDPQTRHFFDAINRPELKGRITPRNPMVAVSMETVPGIISGGLGALGIDQDSEKEARNIPSITVALLLDNWRQAIWGRRQWEGSYPSNFERLGYKKATEVGVFLGNDQEERLDVYIQRAGSRLSIGLRGDLGILYEGPTISPIRLRQSSALGFGGIKAIRKLAALGEIPFEDASSLNLNEAATAEFGLGYANNLAERGVSAGEAIQHTKEITLFTNHTLVQAAVQAYPYEWYERYVLPNLSEPMAVWFKHLFELNGRTGDLNQSHLAFELAGKNNGVSRQHARIASQRFFRLDHTQVNFETVTNGIFMKKWFHPDAYALLQREGVIDEYDLPSKEYQERIDSLDTQELRRIHVTAKAEMLNYLATKRIDQYGKRINIPQDAKVVVFARRAAAYKRPDMMFDSPGQLADILEAENIHLLLASRAHPEDKGMKVKIGEILDTVEANPRLKGRVHFVVNHDEELEKRIVRGADIWINIPEDGYDNPDEDQEAAGTSHSKPATSIIVSTKAGSMADVDEQPYFRVQGNNRYEQTQSFYWCLREAGEITGDDERWGNMVRDRLKVYLPIISSARMQADYINLMYPRAPESVAEKVDIDKEPVAA